MNKNIILCIFLIILSHIFIWFTTNGQFINNWCKKNALLLSITGIPISYLVIKSTAFGFDYFGKLWPIRFIGFAIGIIIFAALTYFYTNEGINTKTVISMILAICILIIQLKL
jgi:hypothetical protein